MSPFLYPPIVYHYKAIYRHGQVTLSHLGTNGQPLAMRLFFCKVLKVDLFVLYFSLHTIIIYLCFKD